jgi:YegS/Rv2252/BmrU family lipid kinase
VKRVVVLRNAAASGGDAALDDALSLIRDIGIEAQVHSPESADHMRFLIRAEARSVDAVVIGGGDGTINSALKPVLEAGLPLGILPLGTANDLARTLGVPTDLHEACSLIASQHTRNIDIGWANARPFVNAAGIGLTTRIARRLSPDSKRLLGPFSYASAVVEAFRRHRPFRAVINSESGTREVSSIQITVGNGVYYGGGTPLTPDSAIDDGRFDLYSVRPQTLMRLIAVAFAVRRGNQAELGAGIDVASGSVFEISTSPRMTVSLDGEPAIQTPVRFRLAARALTVFAPSPQGRPGLTGQASSNLGTRSAPP